MQFTDYSVPAHLIHLNKGLVVWNHKTGKAVDQDIFYLNHVCIVF